MKAKLIILKAIYKALIFTNWLKRKLYLRLCLADGLKLGVGTILSGNVDFGSEPFLIDIGRYCLITDRVSFITHDGSIQVPFIAKGEAIDDLYGIKSIYGRIVLGDNVFVGVGSIILQGSLIGSNSIIAAGSVVKGNFPEFSVIAGNPAKQISNLDCFYEKNRYQVITFCKGQGRESQIKSFFDRHQV